jgi:hypothetical protein
MTNAERLKECIKEKGLKYNYIAKQIGLSYYGLQKKINNKTEFKVSEMEAICLILGIDDIEKRAIFFN